MFLRSRLALNGARTYRLTDSVALILLFTRFTMERSIYLYRLLHVYLLNVAIE